MVKEAAFVTVTYTGYFKGIKTYTATEGKAAFFRIKLLPKTTAGMINGPGGGSVLLSNGLNVKIPANAVKDAATGAAYTGTVSVAAQYIDPSSDEISKTMPGDLRGITLDGFIKGLRSYGMMAVELTGDAGQLLQIADGSKATITMPIPAGSLSSAPASIPLWYFDESNGLWKEEGSAKKVGNTYVGDVAHFSFWNCDGPVNFVHFDCTLVGPGGVPLQFTEVKLYVYGVGWPAVGYTDSSGYVAGFIPANTPLTMGVFSLGGCGTASYYQDFTTTGSDISLGTIPVIVTGYNASISGTLVDCNNMPVTNGSILIAYNNKFAWYNVTGNGIFNINTLLCADSSALTINLFGRDNTALQQGYAITHILVAGVNDIGALQACGSAVLDYYSNGYFYHPTVPRVISRPKVLQYLSTTSLTFELDDLGSYNYFGQLDVDPLTNHVNVSAVTGAQGAPYFQWDDGLPATGPGPFYTPQWANSAECNNTYDPVTHTFRLRYGYLGASGYRVVEEIITGQ